jgi:hypothetical protein
MGLNLLMVVLFIAEDGPGLVLQELQLIKTRNNGPLSID